MKQHQIWKLAEDLVDSLCVCCAGVECGEGGGGSKLLDHEHKF